MKNLVYSLITLFVFSSCNIGDFVDQSTSVIIEDKKKQSKFDKFLERKFVSTYNVDLIYKYVDVETDFDFRLVPATYQNSIRIANLINYLCLEPFNKIAPKDFLKKYFPKQILLVGSAGYYNNGTKVLGTAEGGVKITLFEINNLDITDIDKLNSLYFRTIYHEFAHILHQNIDYTKDFDAISDIDYVGGSWSSNWGRNNPSNVAGFVSNYSSKEANEDFVEIIAFYLSHKQPAWNQIIERAGKNGGAKISRKLELVKNYMQKVWSIDLEKLRDEIQLRSDNLDSQDFDNID